MLEGMLAALALTATPLQDAQSPAGLAVQDSTTSRVDDIFVSGRSVEQQARAYVDTLTSAPGNRRLAAWRRSVCVGITGLDIAYAQFLLDRISAIAASVGLDPGDPGCRPEVLIAVTREPDAVAQAWVDGDPGTFRLSRSGGTDLGPESLDRFKVSDDAVRWWHVSVSVDAMTGLATGGIEVELSPSIGRFGATPSLIQSRTSERLVRTFIVVDADQIGETTFGSLSDYLALIALTQVDPTAATSDFDTVLNLFSGQSSARLSAWDFDYLQSLYRIQTNPIRASAQERRLARTLADRRTQPVPPAR